MIRLSPIGSNFFTDLRIFDANIDKISDFWLVMKNLIVALEKSKQEPLRNLVVEHYKFTTKVINQVFFINYTKLALQAYMGKA